MMIPTEEQIEQKILAMSAAKREAFYKRLLDGDAPAIMKMLEMLETQPNA